MDGESQLTPDARPSRRASALTKTDKYIAVALVAWMLATTAFAAHPTSELQFASMALVPFLLGAILVSVGLVFTRWKRRGMRALLPLLTCGLAAVAPFEVARPIHAAIRAWAFPSYERLVDRIRSGDIPVSGELRRVDGAESQARLAYAVFASRDSNEVLTVEILTGGGFPVRHWGYLYCSSGVIAPGSTSAERWRRRKGLGRGWFEISD